jgi:hypothetical protein
MRAPVRKSIEVVNIFEGVAAVREPAINVEKRQGKNR